MNYINDNNKEVEILKQISKYMETLTYSFIIFAILSLLFQGITAYNINHIDDNVMKIMVKQMYSE